MSDNRVNSGSVSEEKLALSRPRPIYWILSLALAGVLLYFSLQGIEWLRVWRIVRSANALTVGFVLANMSIALFMRAVRWRVLLGTAARVPVPTAFWATSAGYLGNNVLPARAGEVVRTLMISRRTAISRTFVLTTALAERVVDAIALITISATVLLTTPDRPGWLADAAKPFAVLGFSGVAAIVLVPLFEKFWFRFLAHVPLPQAARGRVEHMLHQALHGIRSFHDRSRALRFLGYTAVIWCLDAVTAVATAHAIHLALSWPVAFLLIAGLGLGSALPSTPGYVGIYQFVAVSVLTPFGLSRTDAIAYILLFQAVNYVVVLLWGLIALGRQRSPLPSRVVLEA